MTPTSEASDHHVASLMGASNAIERRDRPERPYVSVVIPIKGQVTILRGQLAALASQTYAGRWELIVVDNGAADGLRDLVGAADGIPSVRLVEAHEIAHATFARNVGAQAAAGDLLLYCDADDEVSSTWMEEMVRGAIDADVVGGIYSFEKLNTELDWDWRAVTPPIGAPRTTFGFMLSASGGAFGIWKDVLTDLGGWNEAFPLSHDTELSWRAQVAGYKLAIAPDAIVEVRHRTSLRGFGRQRLGWAMARAHLYGEFRRHGMPRTGLRIVALTWGSSVYRLPQALLDPRARALWVKRAVESLGHLLGSLRHGVLYL